MILRRAAVSYYIPWDIAFSGSISTPARPTFNASKNTPNGTSLNDTLVRGIPNLVKLLHMVLGWICGPEAISGDISQFYNSVLLWKDHLPYQRFLYKKGLDPNGETIEGVIKTLIYGVRSVSSQTETLIRRISETIVEKHPLVALFLANSRYVDDLAKGVENKDMGKYIMSTVDEVLGSYHMKVKGWAASNEKPSEDISKDGFSVSFAGMTWMCEIDAYSLNHQRLYFANKVRGRLPSNVEFFDPEKYTMAEFVPKILTRRKVTSKFMHRYDLCGKEAPLTLKFKFDLRRLVKSFPMWDEPISQEERAIWIKNFLLMQETNNYWFSRAVVPVDAIDCTKMRVWICYDAAKGGLMVDAWGGYLRKNGTYSCSHLFARGLLANEDTTIPKLELHSLSTGANSYLMLDAALEGWLDEMFMAGDSTISLCWTVYENKKLDVFVRNRVNNVRAKVPLAKLHWVEGPENPADTGTRPDAVSAATVHPTSEWATEKI